MGMNDVHSLSHSKWNCKYHIVFAPKYRRKVFYQEKRKRQSGKYCGNCAIGKVSKYSKQKPVQTTFIFS